MIDEEEMFLTVLPCNAWVRSNSFAQLALAIDSSVNVYASFQIESKI
jgi:hypothetical protein